MRSRVVTIFGGSGFIGRYVVKRLADAGAVIRVPCRKPEQAGALRTLGAVGQVVLQSWEPSRTGEVDRLLTGSTDVVNLIGILFERRAGDFERIHARLPGEVAAAAARQGIERMVQVSALGADSASSSAYARSKAAGEAAVLAAFPRATILRPSVVIGPEDGFFVRFARMAQISPFLPLIDGGRTRFQPVYVVDVATAVEAALVRPEAAGRIYELGGPKAYSFKALLTYLLSVTGRRRLLLPLPMSIARLQANVLQYLPEPPLTPDQLELLKRDNVLSGQAPGLADLGIAPTPMEVVVPQYLRAWSRPTLRLPVV